jgi:phospholipid/cholesterol/gamma-HCH transport system ATP-binding protein
MLVMYDEPFTGQDPINLGVLARLVRKLNDALGTTSVIVSHDVAETLDISDYVYLISDGKVAAQGTPAEIRASGEGSIRQFLRGEADGPVPFHVQAPDYESDLMGAAA